MAIGTGYHVFSQIYNLDHIVQNTAIMAGRNLIIDVLRESFARDEEYKYDRDIFGFPKTPSWEGLDPEAGLVDESSTRLYIGSAYRYDISFLPAIIVKQTSSQYNPISFNQNVLVEKYDVQRIIDGYGNVTDVQVPVAYTYAGAWDQSFEVKVISNSLEDTVAIADTVMITLQNVYRGILQQNGLFVKSVSAGGESVESIGGNDPLFFVSITVQTRSEWYREIPISRLIERIQFCFDIDLVDTDVPAQGMTIKQILE